MKKCSYCGRDNSDELAHCRECGSELTVEVVSPPAEPTRPEFEFVPPSEAEKEMGLVTLVKCRNLVAADLIVSQLDAAGIEAFLPDQFLMQAVAWNFNTYGYVRVQVALDDYEAARDVVRGE